ncbi:MULTISPECIES: bifunctional phosphopantothenoylcysteine decarboxylase/phosphopantothenate--cysteine ligase CoaBC [Sphingobacterium]|uniref:bifunctional phosphopantothenoylcysteine decarboxylase/phosphopantothenate--cysteine ligase CoaBC n=1 Tax=Sphingobacterium TaxID=28453 RepID=UPI0010523B96|nr:MULTISPECIES: bifunctional phosphopantothenoylcysteine decarboxylase/phosphopantothenate--cysteine ligase CoaBC [Sphingobacterium]MCW2261890.1 phosphopantothenoylcysteine decarboxylase/phosphopantothenate--cysteine ligase [Sphingobacterium kitahiroshimense]NJI75150.1 bifunctional phosphopantothenoylcysteine decarboxylase/phosphopantothenate--cysteine ligase CoaBC [Sphingobacterium sp. B16(2022)]TCR13360.1 phosphopantothenoylcysteine decarboxylase/phosphopantothenate--cysteine ligase [Sphingob
MSLAKKNIVIAVCGSIAAYKIAHLTRLLVKEKANVQIIMTKEAAEFITPLTLSTLSNNPVLIDYFDPKTGEWNNHVHIGLQADLILVAPATANTIGKLANGICDSLLTAVYLSAKCPVFIAPAMDLDMWKHPSTQNNIRLLQSYGNRIIHPGNGELASGLIGEGRLAEPEEILDFITQSFSPQLPLSGRNALVTAGPTYEAIDPVRFIGNHSSGKMGYALAKQLVALGAKVTLISGPTALDAPQNVDRIQVTSAHEMLEAVVQHFSQSDIIVMSAAVADYTPIEVASQKIKKKEDQFSIALKKTTDILASIGTKKTEKQLLIGFALETNNEVEHAKDKLIRKNLDFIVLNSMQDKGAGFATDTNKVTVIDRFQHIQEFTLKSKEDVAKDICQLIVQHPILTQK